MHDAAKPAIVELIIGIGEVACTAVQDGLVIIRSFEELSINDVLEFIEHNRVLRNFTFEER